MLDGGDAFIFAIYQKHISKFIGYLKVLLSYFTLHVHFMFVAGLCSKIQGNCYQMLL